jgi:hypothetical protein
MGVSLCLAISGQLSAFSKNRALPENRPKHEGGHRPPDKVIVAQSDIHCFIVKVHP